VLKHHPRGRRPTPGYGECRLHAGKKGHATAVGRVEDGLRQARPENCLVFDDVEPIRN
jgi:hypothetical protein